MAIFFNVLARSLAHSFFDPVSRWGIQTVASSTTLYRVESRMCPADSCVKSLMLSSHIFLCLPRLLFSSIVLCKEILSRLETCPNHDGFLYSIQECYEPYMSLMVRQTYPFVSRSAYIIIIIMAGMAVV